MFTGRRSRDVSMGRGRRLWEREREDSDLQVQVPMTLHGLKQTFQEVSHFSDSLVSPKEVVRRKGLVILPLLKTRTD